MRELLEIQEVIIGGRSIFKHVGLLPYKAGMLLAGGFGVSTVPLIFLRRADGRNPRRFSFPLPIVAIRD